MGMRCKHRVVVLVHDHELRDFRRSHWHLRGITGSSRSCFAKLCARNTWQQRRLQSYTILGLLAANRFCSKGSPKRPPRRYLSHCAQLKMAVQKPIDTQQAHQQDNPPRASPTWVSPPRRLPRTLRHARPIPHSESSRMYALPPFLHRLRLQARPVAPLSIPTPF